MTDLEHQLDQMAERGRPRPIDTVIDELRTALTQEPITNKEPEVLEISQPAPLTPTRRSSQLAFAAAILAVAGVAGTIIVNANRSDSSPIDSAATSEIGSANPDPVMTLPPADALGVPVTALGADPDFSYRLAADVEIGWNSDNDQTQFCWRTPMIEDCGTEPAPGTAPIPVAVSPGQTVAIVAVESDFTKADGVELALSDGTTIRGTVVWSDEPIAIGWARFDTDVATVTSAATTD